MIFFFLIFSLAGRVVEVYDNFPLSLLYHTLKMSHGTTTPVQSSKANFKSFKKLGLVRVILFFCRLKSLSKKRPVLTNFERNIFSYAPVSALYRWLVSHCE